MNPRTVLLLIAGSVVLWLEHRRALRPRKEPIIQHSARNLVVAGLSAATVQLVEAPIVMPLARRVERDGWGLVRRLPLRGAGQTLVTVVLMDYTLYLWHVIVHHVPWLWRYHLVHHIDLDLDASTAVRFHVGEIAASVPWRAAQVAQASARPLAR